VSTNAAVQSRFEVLAEGLLFPEGPVALSDGSTTMLSLPNIYVTSICFGGADRRDAYITMSESGRLIGMRWPTPGLALNFSR